ncbi:MAG: LAGLIDADG family homing endonuclease [Nitrososphaerota archaeon]
MATPLDARGAMFGEGARGGEGRCPITDGPPSAAVGPDGRAGGRRVRRRGSYLPRDLRIKLYEEVRRLRGQGLSYNKISDSVRKSYGVVLGTGQISQWVRGIHSPYNDARITSIESLKPCRGLAYVIGVVAGDGFVRRSQRPRKSYHDVHVVLRVKDREFAEEFSRCIATVLKRDPPKPRWEGRRFVVKVRCKALYQLLRKPLDIERLKPFVENDTECIAAFLRGFFDSEGSVAENGVVTVCNTDLRLLGYVKQLLSSLGIKTTGPHLKSESGTAFRDPRTGKTYKKKKDLYGLYVTAGSRLMFYRLIGFTIERKRQRVENYLTRTGRLKPPADHPSYPPNNVIMLTMIM